MQRGDHMYLGEVLLVDTMDQLRTYYSELTHPRWKVLIEDLGDENNFPDIYDDAVAADVRRLTARLRNFRSAWGFFMREESKSFLAACEDNNVNPAYFRRKIKEEFGLPFSTRLLDLACTQFMLLREQYAGKQDR